MKIRTKKCPNCKIVFTNRADQIVYTAQLKCYSCKACQAVISFKKSVFAVDLSPSPIIHHNLNIHHRIKSLATYQKWAEAFMDIYASPEHQNLPRKFASLDISPLLDPSIPLEEKITTCAIVDNLNREYRLRNCRNVKSEDAETPINSSEMLMQMKALEEHKMFKLLQKFRKSANAMDFITQKLAGDETYLTRLSSNTLVGLRDLDVKFGHYSGTPGNAAMKASTRIWRALRFLPASNEVAKKLWPNTTHLLNINFNQNLDINAILENIKISASKKSATSLYERSRTSQLLNENNIAIDRFFCIRMIRKESRYNVPLCPANRKQFFLGDFGDAQTYTLPTRSYKSCTLTQKNFDYLVFMNIQSRDKMAKMRADGNSALNKMGQDIWLSSVYALKFTSRPSTESIKKRTNLAKKN